MATFDAPPVDAAEAAEAMRGLAHATRTISDPTDIYVVLGSLSTTLHSLDQVLRQLGRFHDNPVGRIAPGGSNDRAAASRAALELHRAARLTRQAAASVDRAHQSEATITYDAVSPSSIHRPPGRPSEQGPAL